MSRNTMLITGVSSGLGKALAEEALRRNWRVVGTVRKEADRQNFEAFDPEHAIGRILDVTEALIAAPSPCQETPCFLRVNAPTVPGPYRFRVR